MPFNSETGAGAMPRAAPQGAPVRESQRVRLGLRQETPDLHLVPCVFSVVLSVFGGILEADLGNSSCSLHAFYVVYPFRTSIRIAQHASEVCWDLIWFD